MAVSLIQIDIKLVTILPQEKDFLILPALAQIQKVCESCALTVFEHQAVEISALELMKYVLWFFKESHKVTPQVVQSACQVGSLFVQKGAFKSEGGVSQILPAVSSICSKSIAQEYKTQAKTR